MVLIISSPVPINIGISSGLEIENNHCFGWIFVFLEQKSGQNELVISDLYFYLAAG